MTSAADDLLAKGKAIFDSGKYLPRTNGELSTAVESCEPEPEQPEAEADLCDGTTQSVDDGAPIYPPPDAPYDVACDLYDRIGWHRKLFCHRGIWMRWNQQQWDEMDADALRSTVYRTLADAEYHRPVKTDGEVVDYERTEWKPNRHRIANVLEAMAAIGYLSTDIDPPVWIDAHSAAKTPADQIISCTNGLLDLSTRELMDHTPAYYNVVSVPFGYDPAAAQPTAWQEFLASVWPDDPDSVALLQEFIGYLLSGRTDMQKMLLLIGPTRSGKGTIARLMPKLIGRRHVTGPTLASLGTNFGLSPLLGKPLAIISDARLGNTPSHTVVERLLSITGEDMLTVDRKFREPWSGKLPTRFMVLSNELPRFKDSSGAIANRLLILRMTESFLGREDRTLDNRLAAELPGILHWALDGLDRLNANGRFTVPRSSEDAANLMMDLASPVSAFVREKCVRGPAKQVERDTLYAAWKLWAEDNGHMPGSKSNFARDLRAVVPELKDIRPRVNGVPVRYYAYIALSGGSGGSSPGLDDVDPTSGGSDQWVNPQDNGADPGDPGEAPFKAQQNLFTPPSGPGRCPVCGWHIESQGHRDGCPAKTRAPIGGITPATPGMTDRVVAALAKAVER
ncbi:DNA primase family protein [Mycobacterium riyadhense]|uniref:SF3 helicase domain-containing protein n=1 Tax=Mycobacterium riyadhense TaxID=486698 RepID=A0A653F2V9_9MYCO|nr:phage/plasmid primase, P4 family [Mycobacterium riyadhense]VTP03960.1 hypothetical protein BIN_B_05329 [Mycobacterium riyadhense]